MSSLTSAALIVCFPIALRYGAWLQCAGASCRILFFKKTICYPSLSLLASSDFVLSCSVSIRSTKAVVLLFLPATRTPLTPPNAHACGHLYLSCMHMWCVRIL